MLNGESCLRSQNTIYIKPQMSCDIDQNAVFKDMKVGP